MDFQQGSFFGLSQSSDKFLFPVVKLGEPLTYNSWDFVPVNGIVVRMHDLLTDTGKQFRNIFWQIQETGGINAFLEYSGQVLLSSIMSDVKIFNSTPEMYLEAIKALKPDFFMTLDGETYSDKPRVISQLELDRVLEQSQYIIQKSVKGIPVGLVKGATVQQLDQCLSTFKKWGITDYIFHTGDFICRGNKSSIIEAKTFARKIRQQAPRFLVYGLGSRKNIQRFRAADGIITQSHFINEFYGIKIHGDHLIRQKKIKPNQKSIMENLKYFRQKLDELKTQGGLAKWAAETVAAEQHMQNNDTKEKIQII